MPKFTVSDIENIATNIPGAEGIAIANDRRIFIGAGDGWIYVITPNGEVSQYVKMPGRPLGIAIDRQDNLFVCDWDAHGVYKVNVKREVTLFADSAEVRKMQYPNFCVFDDEGNLYVSDTGNTRRYPDVRVEDGAIFRITPKGQCAVFVDGLFLANGLALRRGESTIYVIQTIENNVLRFEVNKDGTCGARTVHAQNLKENPDGMAFMENGDLLVAVGSMEIIYHVKPNGAIDIFLEDPNAEKLSGTANPAFGGLNMDELYITNLGGDSVSRIKNVPRGQKLYHQV